MHQWDFLESEENWNKNTLIEYLKVVKKFKKSFLETKNGNKSDGIRKIIAREKEFIVSNP